VESQVAERGIKVCARRERQRLDARLAHRLPPETKMPPERSSKDWPTTRNTERRFCQAKTSAVSENYVGFCLELPGA
jgi:hypothetical protein